MFPKAPFRPMAPAEKSFDEMFHESAGAIGRNGALGNIILGRGSAIVDVDHETQEPWRDRIILPSVAFLFPK
jgi:hypothetical protein